MVHIDTTAHLEGFRRFLINSTCLSFMPESYLEDPEVFPEKEGLAGSIYVEAADKVTLKKIREITFVNATDILGVIYSSKSGNTKLKWRQTRGTIGKVTGEASANSLVNLFAARAISEEYADQLVKGMQPLPAERAPEHRLEEAEPMMEKAPLSVEGDSASSTPEIQGEDASPETSADV